MTENMLRLQVNSLVGGHMVRCTPHEVAAAEQAGAVAVLPDLDTLDDPAPFLETFLGSTSIHPLCRPADFRRFGSTYQRFVEPGAFVVVSPGESVSTQRCFLKLSNVAALDHLVPSTLLAIVGHVGLVEPALRRRDAVDPEIPIYCEAATEDETLAALRAGAEGTLVPSQVDLSAVIDRWLNDMSPIQLNSEGINIGVVALQGDYRFHMQQLRRLIAKLELQQEVHVHAVQRGEDLQRCDAALLPGGWSNLQTLLYRRAGIDHGLRHLHDEGKPILGICAGMILSGSRHGLHTQHRTLLGLIDATIDNNILNGSHLTTEVATPEGGMVTLPAAFSNGPVARQLGDGVDVLARVVEPRVVAEHGQCVVAARQGNVFIASCHEGPATHDVFLAACLDERNRK